LDPPKGDSIQVTVNVEPTLSGDIQPIFSANCAFSGCHAAPDPQLGEDLSSAALTYSTAVNVNSVEAPAKKRIVPGSADQSYTVDKIVGAAGIVGNRMPRGLPPLSAEQIQLIKDWINAGAKNN